MKVGLYVLILVALARPGFAAGVDRAKLNELLKAIEPQVVSWRRDFHQNPELSNREARTAKLVAEHLRRLGMQVETGMAHTAVLGLLKGGRPGPLIGLRADMDALPVLEKTEVPFKSRATASYRGETVGVMHACGHDGHTATLMGIAEVLAQLKESLAGSVLFIFQPSEEGAPPGEEGGARLMIKEGVLDKHHPEAIFALHYWSALRVGEIGFRSGPLMAASDSFKIVVKGRQAHGSLPWHAIDPIVASAQIVTALQTVVSRGVDITDNPAVVSVGAIKGGIRSNIIPERVEMVGTVRTFTTEQRAEIIAQMKRIIENTAAATGAVAEFSIDSNSTPVVLNDPALTRKMRPSLERVAGGDKVKEVPLVTGAEDFSFFAKKVPSFYFFVGVTPIEKDPAKVPSNHSDYFFLDERGLAVGLKALAQVAVDYLDRTGG